MATVAPTVGSLLLSDEQLAALRSVVSLGAATDIDRTYSFKHDLNAKRELRRAGHDRGLFRWHVLMSDASGVCIFEDAAPLARSVGHVRLHGERGSAGLVAINDYFALTAHNRRRGFAAALYAAEKELYERCSVREIQLIATRDGPVVWIKKFGFLPSKPGFLASAFRSRYARDVPADVQDYPDDFLAAHPGLQLYKVLDA